MLYISHRLAQGGRDVVCGVTPFPMMIVNETAKLGVGPLGECGLGSRKRILINDAESLLGVTQQPKTRRRAALDIH